MLNRNKIFDLTSKSIKQYAKDRFNDRPTYLTDLYI